MRAQPGEPVGFIDRNLACRARAQLFEVLPQYVHFVRVHFKQAQAIRIATRLQRNPGRSGIDLQLAVRVEGTNHLQVIGDCRRCIRGIPNRANSLFELSALLRPGTGQVIEASPRMQIDKPVCSGLLVLVLQDLEQYHVFEHIGVVAGMKAVAVAEQKDSPKRAGARAPDSGR